MKEIIKSRLKNVLRQKFRNYTPESSYMPFHTGLLGKDRMALYSFIHSLNTNFGTSIFEPVACELGKNIFTAKKQVDPGNIITKEAQKVIQDIMDALESGFKKPNKEEEIKRIIEVSHKGSTSVIKPTKIDLLLEKDKTVYLIDIKTAKPNKGSFKEFKRTLLTWIATYSYKYADLSINSLIAIPYNPYEPKEYERWTMAGMLDFDKELKVADEFWNFVGGENSYNILLSAFQEVGIEMRDEIDDYFKKFR